MFSWLRDVFAPDAQMGQTISTAEDETETKRMRLNDGDVEEEGFVHVGRSSFFSQNQYQPSPSSSPPISSGDGPNRQQQSHMYPHLPTPQPSCFHAIHHDPAPQSQTSITDHEHDGLRCVPFSLRWGLQMQLNPQPVQKIQKQAAVPFHVIEKKFEYDFHLERSVLQDY